tara:strand:+ start:157 stop:726 length:570 start_codon:yes stop_codon:yes gene_type:complete
MSNTIYNKFYVYAWYKPDGTPVYIGKGSGNRAYRTKKWNVQIVASNLSEKDALAFEVLLISKLGRKFNDTGILSNIAKGGQSGNPLGRRTKLTEESKKKISDSLMGRPAPKPEGFAEKCRVNAIENKNYLNMKDTWGHRTGCSPINKGHRDYDITEMKRLRSEGMTYKEIQNHMGCGYNTVRRYLSGNY